MKDDQEEEDRFHPDPLLPDLFSHKQDDYFALGLVVNWPVIHNNDDDSGWHRHYTSFTDAVKQECLSNCCCYVKCNEDNFLFFLPRHSLHITVASLFPARRLSELPLQPSIGVTANSHAKSSEDWKTTSIQQWKEVLLHASSLPDWPRDPESIELQLESAQIAPSAGILLWKENGQSGGKGGLEGIRSCLRQSVQTLHPHLQDHMRIPDIIHTTFVRYQKQQRRHDSDSARLRCRPSQANAILQEKIVTTHPLFGNKKNYTDNDCTSTTKQTVAIDNIKMVDCKICTSTTKQTVAIDDIKMVDCKIYLQGNDPEDHSVYMTLPLRSQQAKQRNTNDVK